MDLGSSLAPPPIDLQLLYWPYNAPTWFYRVSKKPSMKADLAIYSYVIGFSGQYMSASLMLYRL